MVATRAAVHDHGDDPHRAAGGRERGHGVGRVGGGELRAHPYRLDVLLQERMEYGDADDGKQAQHFHRNQTLAAGRCGHTARDVFGRVPHVGGA